MAISRVDFGGQTLMDLTEDTVTASTLAVGATAHGANGEPIRGELNPSSGVESFNGRTGSVMPVGGDYTDDQISLSSTMHIGGNAQTDVAAALAALLQAINNIPGGITNYPDLSNLPQINGHTLTGNQTAAQLGITDTTNYNSFSNLPQINGHTLTGNQTSAQLGITDTTNYNSFSNLPKINGVTLTGNKTTAQLGIPTGQSVIINDRINNKTTTLKKITISTSDPPDGYRFSDGEIWLTYGNVT